MGKNNYFKIKRYLNLTIIIEYKKKKKTEKTPHTI